jgi:S-adenosylmethionine synthetase
MKMKITIFQENIINQDNVHVELIERKGIGHPDTLSELIAINFSNKYSEYCLDKFGVIPHHWSDKVTIVGGKSEIDYKKMKFIHPIKVFQFGRVTQNIGTEKIDIDKIFKESVIEIFNRVFKDNFLEEYIETHTITHNGAGPDHPKVFYSPNKSEDVLLAEKQKSNDTIALTSFSPLSKLERAVIEIENYLNSNSFKSKHYYTGYDIKVMASRIRDCVDLVVCIPFIALKTESFDFYKQKLKVIREEIEKLIHDMNLPYEVDLYLNTKDFENYVYLTAIGTACDKGDCGAVGRGNRYNGLITMNRPMGIEAPAGKNPTHHSGRIYSEILHKISRELSRDKGIDSQIMLFAKNGDPMSKPHSIVIITTNKLSESQEKDVKELVQHHLSQCNCLPKQIINMDPIEMHRNKGLELYKKD